MREVNNMSNDTIETYYAGNLAFVLNLVRTIVIESKDGLDRTEVQVYETEDGHKAIHSFANHAGETWRRRFVLQLPEGVLPATPEVPDCEQSWGCTDRRPCDPCFERRKWSDRAICMVGDMFGVTLWAYYGGPGRGFADKPWARMKGGRLVVTHSGGLDI